MLINKIILTFFFVGICTVANAQNLRALDNNNGFQNYKFGMNMDQFKNCEFETVEDGDAERCTINRVHKIGDIEARNVELYFIDSNLSKITVNFSSGELSSNLLNAIEAAFGKYTDRKNFPEYSESFGGYTELLGSYNQFSPNETIWTGNKVILKHKFLQPIGTIGLREADVTLEFTLKNYQELKKEYRSKKYTPRDF